MFINSNVHVEAVYNMCPTSDRSQPGYLELHEDDEVRQDHAGRHDEAVVGDGEGWKDDSCVGTSASWSELLGYGFNNTIRQPHPWSLKIWRRTVHYWGIVGNEIGKKKASGRIQTNYLSTPRRGNNHCVKDRRPLLLASIFGSTRSENVKPSLIQL